jgi:DNA polymerase III epsilon subunit-like protein
MANQNYICIFDTETGSVNPETCEVLSLGAVIVHPRKLEIVEGGEFYSVIKPEDRANVSPDALAVNKLTWEELDTAPKLETVWKNFMTFLKQYKTGKNAWGSPVAGGFNIMNFDIPIINRLAKKFGNVDKDGRPDVFHPRDSFDAMLHMFAWLESAEDIRSYSFDNMRTFLGMKAEGVAHNALSDSKDAAKLIIRLLNYYRRLDGKTKFKDSFLNG